MAEAVMRDHKVWKQAKKKQKNKKAEKNVSSWRALRSLFSCKTGQHEVKGEKNCKKVEATTPDEVSRKCSSASGCNASSRSLKSISSESSEAISASFSSISSAASITTSSFFSSSFSSAGGSFRGVHARKLSSGCHECQVMVDSINGPSRDPSARLGLCSCPDCGEIFLKSEALELHWTERHAVSELSQEDASRKIIEIIFQSSWVKKQTPACKIDRILRVHNREKTITMFENYRDLIRARAKELLKKHPRCIADGNELLRFHCATSVYCSLGLNGSTSLCQPDSQCKVCSILSDGFRDREHDRIQMMSTSSSAHEVVRISTDNEQRAMLVCRVIAGRVKKSQEDEEEDCDSVAGSSGTHSDMDELFVLKPESILPCFVVIYRAI